MLVGLDLYAALAPKTMSLICDGLMSGAVGFLMLCYIFGVTSSTKCVKIVALIIRVRGFPERDISSLRAFGPGVD